MQSEEISELLSWKSLVSVQLDSILKEHALLRFSSIYLLFLFFEHSVYLSHMLHESSKEKRDKNKITFKITSCACLNSEMVGSFDCRSEVEMVRRDQTHMENKGIVIFLVCVVFGFMAIVRSFADKVVQNMNANVNSCSDCVSRKFCSEKSSWFYLLLSCSITIIILSL